MHYDVFKKTVTFGLNSLCDKIACHKDRKHKTPDQTILEMSTLPPNIPEHSDDVEEETRRIKLALSTVFTAQSNRTNEVLSARDVADAYLTSFQQLPTAWLVCDGLLREDTHVAIEDEAKRFFAAQTLHSKCRFDIHQLPAER